MNSQELKKEIEAIEAEIKTVLSDSTFRQLLARMNFLHGALETLHGVFTRVEAKEKQEVEKVKEDVSKTGL